MPQTTLSLLLLARILSTGVKLEDKLAGKFLIKKKRRD